MLVNTAKETENVVRVATKLLGESNVGDKNLPMLAAEDFAYYVEKVPGCFFFLGAGEEGKLNAVNHSSSFEFNDHLLPIAVQFWIRLVEDRLGVSLF